MAFFLEPWNPVDPDLFRKSSLEYFPDRSPLASGDHGITPSPISFAMGISSRSVVRSMILYSFAALRGDLRGSLWVAFCVLLRRVSRFRPTNPFPRDEVVHRSQNFFDSCRTIPDVQVEQVDVISLESLKTCFN